MLTLTATTQLTGYNGDGGYIRGTNDTITFVTEYGVGAGTPVVYDAQRGGLSYLARSFLVPGMPSSGDSVGLSLDSSKSDTTFATYSGSSAGVAYIVRQLRLGPRNPTLPLRFTSIAYARTVYVNVTSGETLNGVVPFAFGLAFDYDLASLVGSASYDGLVVGNGRALGGSNAYDITGNVHIDVNYSTTEFTGYLELRGRDDRTGEVVTFSRVNISPYRPRGALDFLLGSLDGGGSFQANFAGSVAQELMGGFDLQLPDPRAPTTQLRISGTLAAKK